MQLSGSLRQSMSQRKRSQANQPIGGVLISPLSRAQAAAENARTKITPERCMSETQHRHPHHIQSQRPLFRQQISCLCNIYVSEEGKICEPGAESSRMGQNYTVCQKSLRSCSM